MQSRSIAVLDRLADQALGTFARHRLDADTGTRRKANLGNAQLRLQEVDQLLHFLRAGRVLDAGVDVLGVLAKHGHVDQVGIGHRRLHAREIADRPHAGVQVQRLANRDVQRANATAGRRRQRTLDRDDEALQRMQRFVGQVIVVAVHLGCPLPGVDLHPAQMPLVAIGLLDGCIDDVEHDRRNIDADAVTFDERNDRNVRNDQRMIGIGYDSLAVGRHFDVIVLHEVLGR